ncbi:tripartite tricarboxylate transporter TctB family protein [Kribbella antiqua]|uniref:Tripartite tricarboxylate transporter TctB family protein n=1 Tax=Kribbella antiqua TaxID=2512217 RepID=A0A4R2IJI5_9ACTN|nr:tripartite tricarboxylate transporter TctB family protein [Kribbella antiqua]TCO44522.1 tripartite tricarboxylate transporter TctB family protein [Kribbella antiqua]
MSEVFDEEALRAELAEDRPPHAGPWSQLGAAVVTGLIGVAGVVGSLGLGLGRLTAPGPGLWPFVVSVVITTLSVVLALTGRRGTDTEKFSRASVMTAIAVLTLVLLALLLPLIGFEIPSLLLTFVWLRFLGKESWRSSIAISVATVAAFYLLFVVLLQIPLPRLI